LLTTTLRSAGSIAISVIEEAMQIASEQQPVGSIDLDGS
jgi:hypothetical protein